MTEDDPRRFVRESRAAFLARPKGPPGALVVPGKAPPLGPETRLPTLSPGELSAAAIRAGIAIAGAVHVPGLFDGPAAAALRGVIDSAYAARERVQNHGESPETVPFYDEFPDVRDAGGRAFVGDTGVYAADSPGGFAALLAAYGARGVDALVEEYFGERPALSFEKTALRRVAPAPATSWHQDGAFLGGAGIRSLNLWVSLSRCGRRSPGLEIVPRRVEHIVERGGMFDWDIADATLAREFPDVAPVLPELEVGDALFFDHLCVHRTGQMPGMTEHRYAIESWFFPPSVYPESLTGFLV